MCARRSQQSAQRSTSRAPPSASMYGAVSITGGNRADFSMRDWDGCAIEKSSENIYFHPCLECRIWQIQHILHRNCLFVRRRNFVWMLLFPSGCPLGVLILGYHSPLLIFSSIHWQAPINSAS